MFLFEPTLITEHKWEVSTIPFVSICTTTYNHKNFIEECLNGFLEQTTKFPVEILIHDDASTDGTQEIIKHYQKKYPHIIKPWFQKENQWSQGVRGLSYIYNFSRAKGKYIAMCEGDDFWKDSLKLQKQVDSLEKNKKYALSFHDVQKINRDGKIISKNKLPKKYRRNLTSKEMCEMITIPTLSILFRNEENLYKFGNLNVLNGDKVLITYLSEIGCAKYHSDIKKAFYRVHENGIWSEISSSKKIINNYKTFTELSQKPFKFKKTLKKCALINLYKIKKIDNEFYRKEIRNFSYTARIILSIKLFILKIL